MRVVVVVAIKYLCLFAWYVSLRNSLTQRRLGNNLAGQYKRGITGI